MERIGRYQLLGIRGEGGAGRVYEAQWRGPGGTVRRVALKVLKVGTEDLRREARIGGLLRHRHLVDVYEVGEVDGQWFCAMELCDGALSRHLPLSRRATVEVGLAVCRALQYAQEELGLVHLDLKPSNLLHRAGVVKVADLGIARAVGFEGDGRIRGTRGYMAPEQARGEPVDGRADIFALGVTLAELATGSRPTASQTLDLESLDLTGELSGTGSETLSLDDPAAGSSVAGFAPELGVPSWLAGVVDRCLADDPRDRWPDLAGLVSALGQIELTGPDLRAQLGIVEGLVEGPQVEADSRFVGREAELGRVRAGLATAGVVAISGAPGVGKSRLAEEALRHFGGPVVRCDAAAMLHLEALCASVAQALDLTLTRGDPVARIGDALAGRGPAALWLDNVDGVDGLDAVVEGWLEGAPELRVVLTARAARPGGIAVSPLPPDEAQALLVARALERGVELVVDAELATLADKLDGLPLALELAAGRLGVLSIAEVCARLDLSLLRSAGSGRQGTLRGTLDWSWEQTAPADREVLLQLGVFEGAIALEAAEAVVQSDGDLVDRLGGLVDASWLHPAGAERLRLLRPVRDYVRERDEGGPEAMRRHGAYFAGLGRPTLLYGPGAVERRRALVVDLEELLVAVERALEDGDAELATRSAGAAWAALELVGPLSRAVGVIGTVLELPELEPGQQVRLLRDLGRAQMLAGDGADAVDTLRRALALAAPDSELATQVLCSLASALGELGLGPESLEVAEMAVRTEREAGRVLGLAAAASSAGTQLRNLGRLAESEQCYLEALAAARRAQDERFEAVALANLGTVLRAQGQGGRAQGCVNEAIRVGRRLGDLRMLGTLHGNAGNLAADLGELDVAAVHYTEALELLGRVGERRAGAVTRVNMGILCAERGDGAAARMHYEAGLATARAIGERRIEGWLLGPLGTLLASEGRHEEAERCMEGQLELARAVSDRQAEAEALGRLAQASWRRGARAQALSRWDEAIEVAQEVGDVRGLASARCALARGLAELGRLEEAEAQLGLASGPQAEIGDSVLTVRFHCAWAEVRLAQGDGDGAGAALDLARAAVPAGHVQAAAEVEAVAEALGRTVEGGR